MHNAFLLCMPPGNREAMVHYEEKREGQVTPQGIAPFVQST
jgi:hypothetical protein